MASIKNVGKLWIFYNMYTKSLKPIERGQKQAKISPFNPFKA